MYLKYVQRGTRQGPTGSVSRWYLIHQDGVEVFRTADLEVV